MFEKILQEIRSFDTVVIHRHSRPDGDALGSQIGLKHILKENFPEKTVYVVGDSAGYYSFMDDTVMDEIPDSVFENALAIILDCGSKGLICDDRYQNAAKTVRIDHHIFSGAIADVEVIDSTFESCCGMITELACESGLRVPEIAARSLFSGLITDSGRFRYDSTSARSLRLASFLMEQGFHPREIYRNLYSDTFERKKLRAQFLLKTQFTKNNVAYFYTTREELQELNIDPFTASRGMVNTMADIKGVDIWVNFTESEEGVLCELRSEQAVVHPIAVKYGGGGHAKACGATVADHAQAMEMLQDLDKLAGGEL